MHAKSQKKRARLCTISRQTVPSCAMGGCEDSTKEIPIRCGQIEVDPIVGPGAAESKLWPEETWGNLDAQGYGKQGWFDEAYSQTPGGRGCGSPSPAGKELGRWRQARATGLGISWATSLQPLFSQRRHAAFPSRWLRFVDFAPSTRCTSSGVRFPSA